MRNAVAVLVIGACVACAQGADMGGSGSPGPGAHEDGTDGDATGQASAWDGVESSDSGSSTAGNAGVDEQDTTSDDGVDGGSSSEGASETESESGGLDGDPLCPPGFALAFAQTDAAADELPQTCSWVYDVLLSESSRISFEWWGTSGQHYGPVIWDLSAHDTLVDAYGDCIGTTAHVESEDGAWWMTLVPTDSYVFLTHAGDDVQTGAAHLYGWLASEHQGSDEIMGIDFPSIAEAWGAKDTPGDRWVGCYDPAM